MATLTTINASSDARCSVQLAPVPTAIIEERSFRITLTDVIDFNRTQVLVLDMRYEVAALLRDRLAQALMP